MSITHRVRPEIFGVQDATMDKDVVKDACTNAYRFREMWAGR